MMWARHVERMGSIVHWVLVGESWRK